MSARLFQFLSSFFFALAILIGLGLYEGSAFGQTTGDHYCRPNSDRSFCDDTCDPNNNPLCDADVDPTQGKCNCNGCHS